MSNSMIEVKAAAQKALSKIGKTNGSAPLESTKNTFHVAHELFVSDVLRKASAERYDQAKAAAIEAGVINDPSTYVGGTDTVAFDSEHLIVSVKKNNDSEALDKTKLTNELTKRYGAVVCLAILKASTKPKAGATNINMSMK